MSMYTYVYLSVQIYRIGKAFISSYKQANIDMTSSSKELERLIPFIENSDGSDVSIGHHFKNHIVVDQMTECRSKWICCVGRWWTMKNCWWMTIIEDLLNWWPLKIISLSMIIDEYSFGKKNFLLELMVLRQFVFLIDNFWPAVQNCTENS